MKIQQITGTMNNKNNENINANVTQQNNINAIVAIWVASVPGLSPLRVVMQCMDGYSKISHIIRTILA